MKVKKIGNIVLTYPLWWTNYNNVTTIQSEVSNTIDGGVVIWKQPYHISSQLIDLSSNEDGWQTTTIKDSLKALIALGTTSTITLEDDTVINIRFRDEVNGGCVVFERLIKTSLSDYYTCDLFLAKV